MKKIILASLLTIFGTSAMADQCAFVTKPQAKKAIKLLLDAQSVQLLCEPCGDTKSQTVKIESVGIRKVDKNLNEVMVNGAGIDLAYTFVYGFNLAQMAGCTTEDVSSSISK